MTLSQYAIIRRAARLLKKPRLTFKKQREAVEIDKVFRRLQREEHDRRESRHITVAQRQQFGDDIG